VATTSLGRYHLGCGSDQKPVASGLSGRQTWVGYSGVSASNPFVNK
jgi:hypothetical protein